MNNVTTPNSNIYQSGNTIRLSCQFTAEMEGERVDIDPHDVFINIYDRRYQLLETIPAEQITKLSVGDYVYPYTLPQEETVIIYEWVGNLNGEEVKKRGTMQTVFLDY